MRTNSKMAIQPEISLAPADRPWLASYPPGVPHDIDPEFYASLVGLLEDSVRRFAQRPAFSALGDTMSYADLDRYSRAFATFLQQSLRLAKGERIAIMMPNVLQYPVVLFGALRAGLVVVNTNPLYTARELKHQLNDADAHTIVVLENFAHVLASCIADTPVRNVLVARTGDMSFFPKSVALNFAVKHIKKIVPRYDIPGEIPLSYAFEEGGVGTFERVDVGPDDLAFLQYTGGTTGLARGAMLTHRNMVANVEQAAAWIRPHVTEGQEVIITALPLYHIFSLTANCLTFMKIGGLNQLIPNPRDMRGFVRTLRPIRFSAISGVNTLFNGLLNTRGFDKQNFSALKVSLAGGTALQKTTADRWAATTGSTIAEAYGLTEASPAVCINPLDLDEYNGCIGLPVPSTEVSIRDEQGVALGANEAGELWVRGPQVMRGYWRQAEETAKVLSDDGWLRTGDIGEMQPDGYVRLLDRKKDVILVSGFNVYPNEVEDAIAELEGVREVGVIGVRDTDTGEAVLAVIVKGDPSITELQVRKHCREVLTAYKQPAHILFVSELPKNNVGKVLRRELRKQYAEPGSAKVETTQKAG
ncbi:MAG TPA: AMP-binding protein [Woeseiaceae bacterium]|nr:AMP-binding protein [Woeseiaceae bacterium]